VLDGLYIIQGTFVIEQTQWDGHLKINNLLSFCPCTLLCSLTAVPLYSASRGTAATTKQIIWNRSAWRRYRIRGERNKLTETVCQNLCIIAERGQHITAMHI